MCAGKRASSAVLLALASTVPGAVPATEAPSWEESIVTEVVVRSDVAPGRRAEVLELITVEPGDRLTEEAVARSLRNLTASGRAGAIDAVVEREGTGLRVVFVLRGRTIVDSVELTGELGVRDSVLRPRIEQGAGVPLYEDRVFRSVYSLQDALHDEGYLDAAVRVRVDEDARKRAVVTFQIDAGPPYQVGGIAFDGSLAPVGREALLGRLRMRSGERFRPRQLRAEKERLEAWLLREGYRTAELAAPRWEVEEDSQEVALTYPVEVGPRFDVAVEGGDLEDLQKAGAFPFLGAERYDEALALAAERNIRTYYQERGHYHVKVARRDEVEEGVRRIVFEVETGPVLELTAVELEGNETFSRERLLALMKTTPPRRLSRGSGRLVDAWLEEDLRNLRSFYALEGFLGRRVGPPQVSETGKGLTLRIPIDEGRRRLVGDLSVEGAEALGEKELLTGLRLELGGPFHPLRLEEAVDEIRARYEEIGYSSARVASRLTWNPDESLAGVVLVVLEGPRVVLDRVILRGYGQTEPGLIRAASGLKQGEPVFRRRLLEAQRRLYGLGIFSRVDVELVPGTPYSSERDVLIRVREGKRSRVTYGAGYDSEDGPRGIFGVSRNNLFGRAASARLDLRASARDRQARILLHQPYLGRARLPMTYSLFGVEEERESFASERLGGQTQVDRFGERWRASLLATYKSIKLDPGSSLEPLDLRRDLQDVEISSLTPSFFLDLRDDPVEPTTGWSSNLLLELAQPVLGGEADFTKIFGQQTLFRGLGNWGVVAVSLRLGGIEPGSQAEVGDLPPRDLPSGRTPISERFFAGGRTTHRAYRRDDLGLVGESVLLCRTEPVIGDDGAVRQPTCEDPIPLGDPGRLVPVGGNGLALLNVDYRFPVAGAFGGTVFFDAGNVWADWRDIDPSEAKLGAGVGVRYRSPVGPVRLEIGWKLDREPLEDPYVVFFSFGNPF